MARRGGLAVSRWSGRDDVPRGADYDQRWKAMAEAGESIHGEVELVEWLIDRDGFADPVILDAGCGTGRVAIELAIRGYEVVGVDLDEVMLAEARSKAPQLTWTVGDLLDVDLGRTFDLVVMPGNVMIFVAPGTEATVLANLARQTGPGGLVVAGFQTGGGRLTVDEYDAHCRAVGLEPVDRWSTWDRRPFAGGDYAVSVHRAA